MVAEITVILKDAERTYRQKFLHYDPFEISLDSPVILSCILDAKHNFSGDPETIQVKIHMEIQ